MGTITSNHVFCTHFFSGRPFSIPRGLKYGIRGISQEIAPVQTIRHGWYDTIGHDWHRKPRLFQMSENDSDRIGFIILDLFGIDAQRLGHDTVFSFDIAVFPDIAEEVVLNPGCQKRKTSAVCSGASLELTYLDEELLVENDSDQA